MDTLASKQTTVVVETIDALLQNDIDVNATFLVDEATDSQSTPSPIDGASVPLIEQSSSVIVGGIAPTGAPEPTNQPTIAPAVPVVASEEDGGVKVTYILII